MDHIALFPAVLGNKLNAPHHLHHHHHRADFLVCLKGVKHLHVLKSFSFSSKLSIKAVFVSLLLLLTVTVGPLSLMPHSLHLCLEWEGSCAPSASPWIDPSVTPSWSCDMTAHWRLTPVGSRRRFHHWWGWSCCWTLAWIGQCRSWNLPWLFLLAFVQKGQSRVQKGGLN